MTRPPWTDLSPDEKRAAVKERILTGASHRQIAAELGAKTSVSIACVVDRLRELGELPPAPTKQQIGAITGVISRVKLNRAAGLHAGNIANKAESRKSDPGMAITRVGAFDPLPGLVPVAFAINAGCRWPVDGLDGLGLLACGGSKEPEHVYCAAHRRLAYLAPTSKHRRELKAAERLS